MGDDRDDPVTPAAPSRSRRYLFAPWLVLCIGCTASASMALIRHVQLSDDQRAQFRSETDDAIERLMTTARGYEVVVDGVDGLLRGDPEVDRAKFHQLTDALVSGGRLPGVIGALWTQAVPADQLAAVRARCDPQVAQLAPDPAKGAALVVTQAEPEAMSAARCIDAAVVPQLETALEIARDTGRPQMTSLLEIPTAHDASERGVQTGFMLVRPVYETPAVPASIAERRALIRGWAGAMLDDHLFVPSSRSGGDPFRIELFDGATTDRASLIASSTTKADPAGRTRSEILPVYGHEWTVRMTEAHATSSVGVEPLILLLGGMAITGLAMALMLAMARSEHRAMQLVHEATDSLSRSERRLLALLANATELITVAGPDGQFLYVSPACERLLGHPESELIGRDLMNHVHPDDSDRVAGEISTHVASRGTVGPLEFRVRHRDSSWRHIEAVGYNLLDDPAVEGIIFNYRDITERKAFEHDLAFQATHDPLTGLPNRVLLLDRLGQAIARSTRSDGRPAVLFVDLDRFKLVNDSLGHGAGDHLLSKVANRIRNAVRPGDTVARFGGDEFVVLAEGIRDAQECSIIAERLGSSLGAPFNLSGNEVFVSASIGVRLAHAANETPDALLRDADAAMYRAKERGRARTEWFDEQSRWRSVDRLATENALHRALDRDELRLYYQPQLDLETGRMLGVEGLVRWIHPERGLVGPAEFIELAEETGLIIPIGEWVMREACRQGQEWRRHLPPEVPFVVSANLSACQLAQPDLVEIVARALHDTGFAPESLCLEITEGALMQDVLTTARTLASLKTLGIRLSIDDFGTGHASLGHLKRFPVDSLKIDRTFVDGLGVDPDDHVIVAAVIGLAHALGIAAVAEGVETESQLAELRTLRCDAAQGYLFSRPVEAAVLGDLSAARVERWDDDTVR